MKQDWDHMIKIGYAKYGVDWSRRTFYVCRWYLYPLFRLPFLATEFKYDIYTWLNHKGYMHSEPTKVMQFTDLFKKERGEK